MTNSTKLGLSALALVAAFASAAAAEGDTIKIGYVTGLSGACSSLSEDGLNGSRLAVDQLNANGGLLGRQIELIVRDSQTKPDSGGKHARELVASDEVDLLTGVCSSAVLLAVEAVAAEAGVPHYAIIGSTQKANVEAFHPNFWQTQPNATMEAYAAAAFVADNAEWKRIQPMGFDYEWGHTSVDAFSERLKELRPDVEIADPIFVTLGDTNMGPYIAPALSTEPDVIYAAVFGGGLVNLIKQGQGFGLFERSNLLTLLTVDALQTMGDTMPKEHVYGIARAPFFALEQTEELAGFIESYSAEYNEYPTDWAINGYDGIMIYATAVEAAGSTELEAVMSKVYGGTFDVLHGKGLTVRAFDGQMNAPSYVGAVTPDAELGFSTMQDVSVYPGDTLMWSEEKIQALRDAAK